MAQSGKGLTGRPAESEAPGTEINNFQMLSEFAKTALFYKEENDDTHLFSSRTNNIA
ncbi:MULTISPECIES: hypothetical protein [Fictibacillus]|jgi:hypothetical protein|uniref:hypothetical protein n=1 Tax=Fictibacillus TaxID=1329200 RepID=UPI0018CFABFB|nr:hypothetical protein [Fictibacillus sp. 26RED30]MBH0162594.1 hypothetical protein [Fictibacillus sp. 26RED30]